MQPEPQQPQHPKSQDNSIFIGSKPIKNYLNSINLQLKKEIDSSIILKARGKFISKAVDIAELSKRNPSFNLKVAKIETSTEEYQKGPELTIKVSTIEIHLEKNPLNS